MTKNKGFTVIELMAVVAIISILAVLALAAYSDYVVRSKVAEGLMFAAEAKTAVSSYYYDRRRMPTSNAEGGLSEPESYDDMGSYIRRLELSSSEPYGVITITFKLPNTKADNKELQLIPSTMDGVVYWRCQPPATNGIDPGQVPPNCRG
jgi:type IV pilus assembly protein PilA